MASRNKVVRKKSVNEMKKDISCNVSTGTEHPNMVEEANLKASYQPGKKGGNFGLPLGAKLTVPAGIFCKKESITCHVTPPSSRWKICPELPCDEHITSEVFQLSSSVPLMKTPVIVQIPYYRLANEHLEINVKGKWKGEMDWVNVGFIQKVDTTPPSVELELSRLGSFVVTYANKKEIFNVTPQGCLYNARISRYISCRFPKKCIEANLQCAIQIRPMSTEKLEAIKQIYTRECSDLIVLTEFIDIIPNMQCSFRRAATLKLPLPSGVEIEKEQEPDIGVLHKNGDSWDIIDSNYKFTRTTVSCEIKKLGSFCVALSRPERKGRLREAVKLVDGGREREKGEMVLYLSLQEKSWIGVVECVPEAKFKSRIMDRKERGFTVVQKVKTLPKVEEARSFSYSRRQPIKEVKKENEDHTFHIYDELTWEIGVGSDIKLTNDSDLLDNKELCFYRNLPESYRKFDFEPLNNEERPLTGIVELVPKAIEDEDTKQRMTVRFEFEIDADKVREFFKPEYVPEPEKIKVTFDLPELEPVKEEKTYLPQIQTIKTISATVMDRLTKPTRKPRIIERESRVLTGKSLMNLSRRVPEGLTIAVHLDLPDSTITGLGFDAISNGLTMADVTYKILLYWKRKLKDKKDLAVNELANALSAMGRPDVGDIIVQCHKNNKELTEDYLNEALM